MLLGACLVVNSLLITGGTAASRLAEAKKTKALEFDISTVSEVRELERVIATGQSVIIKNAQNLTEEAQNAFLKTLEEPPANTTIILLAENEDQLLPTIVSRCFVENFPPEADQPRAESNLEKLKEVTDRTEAINIIDSLLTSVTPYTRKLFKAKKYLLANTNVRLTLENIFLN